MSVYVGCYLWGIIVLCSLFPTIPPFFLEATQNCAVLQVKFAMALRIPQDAEKQVSDQLTGFLRSANRCAQWGTQKKIHIVASKDEPLTKFQTQLSWNLGNSRSKHPFCCRAWVLIRPSQKTGELRGLALRWGRRQFRTRVHSWDLSCPTALYHNAKLAESHCRYRYFRWCMYEWRSNTVWHAC